MTSPHANRDNKQSTYTNNTQLGCGLLATSNSIMDCLGNIFHIVRGNSTDVDTPTV